MSEEERAAEYRRTVKARERAMRTNERALRGDPAAKQALVEATKALLPVDENGVWRADVRH